MKLKKWLFFSHIIILLTPVILGIILYLMINTLDDDFVKKLYLINKCSKYEEKLLNTELYEKELPENLVFVEKEDKGKIEIRLYNDLAKLIYSSNKLDEKNYVNLENLYSNLNEINNGGVAYELKKPIIKDRKLIGFFKITILRSDFIQGVNYGTIWTIVSFIIIALVVFVVIMIIIHNKLNRPIMILINGMKKFAEGKDISLNYNKEDEVGELIKHFKEMKKELKHKDEEILKEKKEKEFMISAISHDLKTPLTTIRANSETILSGENLNYEKIKLKVDIILSKSDYIKNMIDDLMMYSVLTCEYDLNFVILEDSEVFEMLFSGYEISYEKGYKLEIDINVNSRFKIDVSQITRVVDNLMTNALRYAKKDGSISLGAYSMKNSNLNILSSNLKEKIKLWKKEGIVILVKNQLDKLDGFDKEKIFIPFSQCDSSRNKKNMKGVGLGLSIVKLIIEKHNGEIKVFLDSDEVVFVCWIPEIK